MTISYLEPTAEPAAPQDDYTLRLDCSRRPLVLGLLANSFPDSRNFMDCVEEALTGLLPGAVFKRYQKPTVDPVAANVLADIARDCQGVVAGWGH
jgi:hypothetical protein